MGSAAPRAKAIPTAGESRPAYQSQAAPITTAISEVAKTGPGTLPTYSRIGSNAEVPP